MSKRLSTTKTNTLYNYFPISPKRNHVDKSTQTTEIPSTSKSAVQVEREDDDEEPLKCATKKLRLDIVDPNFGLESDLVKEQEERGTLDSIDSDDESFRLYLSEEDSDDGGSKSGNNQDTTKDQNEEDSVNLDTSGCSDESFTLHLSADSDCDSDTKENNSNKENENFNLNPLNKSQSENFETTTNKTSLTAAKVWTHNSLPFLQPERIRDANKNKMDHPDYDNRTLYVPEDFLNSQTPAMRQWWVLKSQNYDSIMFFKIGKVYELYHMDAVTAVSHSGLTLMKEDIAHSCVHENNYDYMANMLIEKNFKVSRVELTETSELMAERCRSAGKSSN